MGIYLLQVKMRLPLSLKFHNLLTTALKMSYFVIFFF